MTHLRSHRPAALAILAALAGLCLAACGSSSGSSTASASAAASSPGSASAAGRRSAFVACLKSHGVTLPSRPAGARRPLAGSASGTGGTVPPGGSGYGPGGGPGFFGGGRPGRGFAATPKMRAAFQACGGQRFKGRRAAFSHAAITRFAACVKQHGYTLPAANFSGKGPIYPARIEHNKKFQTAARACQSDLRPAGAPAPAGRPGTATSSSSNGHMTPRAGGTGPTYARYVSICITNC